MAYALTSECVKNTLRGFSIANCVTFGNHFFLFNVHYMSIGQFGTYEFVFDIKTIVKSV